MSTSPYSYWPIVDRPGFKWPDDKAFAVYVGVNVETWAPEGPATPLVGFTAGLPHDPLNQGWRDYGNRVGVWRLMDILDDLDLRATVLLNADVCAEYPEVVAAGVDREWSYLAHGRNSSQLWTGLSEDEERGLLKGIVEDLSAAVGSPPSGWLGPGLSETENTPSSSRSSASPTRLTGVPTTSPSRSMQEAGRSSPFRTPSRSTT